jgi:putative membrane protein
VRGFLTRLLVTALGLWLAATILPGFRIEGAGNLVLAALLLGIVNAVVRPIVFLLTLPLTIVTLGLFILVVNGACIALVAWLIPGVTVSGLFAATLGALVVSVVSWFASSFVGSTGRLERFERRIEVRGRRVD